MTVTAVSGGVEQCSWRTRLVARVFAGRLDNALAVGAPVTPGTPIAAHAARLTSARQRRTFARTLAWVLQQTREARRGPTAAAPVDRRNVGAVEDVILAIIARLQSTQPVSAMGMARLRRILIDGAGPLYVGGRGDLDGRLRAVLAVL
jgi:hypothetical protein